MTLKPFLRWAGGKSWLVPVVSEIISKVRINSYHEPFLGGGAIYFNIMHRSNAFLSDNNSDLVNAYNAIKEAPYDVIEQLSKFKNSEREYYRIRDDYKPRKDINKAARFIYLNQTSFNGIYRVNLNGKYNVPYGKRKKKFLDRDLLLNVSEALQKSTIFRADFENVLKNVKKNDLVYLDPPYTITHNQNGFLKYNEKLFSISDQKRLSVFIDQIKYANAYYILSNAAHKEVKKIFYKDDRIIEVKRNSLIGGLKAKRGVFQEYIFTNIENE